MTITTAAEAAQAWVEGRREECREWCYDWYSDVRWSEEGELAIASRTAAVALAFDDDLAGDMYDFLRYMKGTE